MNDSKLQQLVHNLSQALYGALTAPDNRRQVRAEAVATVVNGQLGPYLHAQAAAIADPQAKLAAIKTNP
jgi:hypothetical protein